MKTNRIAALAGAGFIASALAVSPAQAADLGGDCCADLEERVATLEATTARKGNRKVSLTISGWVNSGLYIWDDGVASDAYVASDNGTTLGSRFTFAGAAKINSDWSAGYNITIEAQQDDVFLQGTNQNQDDSGTNLSVLYSYMYVKSETYGTLSLGKQSQATDNISIVDLSGTLFSGNNIVFEGNTFLLRNGNGNGALSATTWGTALGCSTIGQDCHGVPFNVVKYETPTIAGFTVSASWGEDDFWDVAAKYAGQFGDFKVAAAVGYSEFDGTDAKAGGFSEQQLFEVGGSIMHVPTGIFVSSSYTDFELVNFAATGGSVDTDSWYIKAGIKQRWNSLGDTAIYGEYGQYNDGLNSGSEVERIGLGIHQWVDAASMQLYAKWDHLELEGATGANTVLNGNEFDQFTLGGVIFF